MDTIALESQYTSGFYAKRNITIVRGQGALLYDDTGKEYVDCVGGQGAGNLGHAHPKVVAAIAEQAGRLITCPEMFYNDRRAELLRRLVSVAPDGINRVYLCNSGTEAVEAALKVARAATGRKNVVAAQRGFHGRTFGSLSATWNKKYREPFFPLLEGFSHVPYNDLEALSKAVSAETAAVILEVIQGEGGVYPGTREFLCGAQELCRKNGALLIIDEVQTGIGRTGKLFALEHHGLQPDLVSTAKSIAGGVPMGALLIGERVGPLATGIHGSTFGGNPLACAASLAALDAIEQEGLLQNAAEMGAYLTAQLRAIPSPLIREVRGMGLMVGVEIKKKVAPYLQALMDEGVLALSAGMTVIRLLPPLVITRPQIDAAVAAIAKVLDTVNQDAGRDE